MVQKKQKKGPKVTDTIQPVLYEFNTDQITITSSSLEPYPDDYKKLKVAEPIEFDESFETGNLTPNNVAEDFRLYLQKEINSAINYDVAGIVLLAGWIKITYGEEVNFFQETGEYAACFYGRCLLETFNGKWHRDQNGRLEIIIDENKIIDVCDVVFKAIYGHQTLNIPTINIFGNKGLNHPYSDNLFEKYENTENK